MKIAISTLFFYNPELCKEFVASILPSLKQHLVKNSADSIEFVITDNTPKAQSILADVQKSTSAFLSENGIAPEKLRFFCIQSPFNKGFGQAHNDAFDKFPSDAFVILNNDLFIKEDSWLAKLCAPLKDAQTALVGVKSSPRVLSADAEGTTSKDHKSDYAEGSILAVQSSLIKKHGLFAKDLPLAYFEDSDLSLRYRQMGYKIDFVEIEHEHRRGSSAALLGKDLLGSVRARNKSRFSKRWQRYFKKRSFDNKIFLDFVTGGWGDVVAAIPVVTGILRDHPTCTIDLQTNHKDLARLLAFPRVSVTTDKFRGMAEVRNASRKYDRAFSLNEVDYSSLVYLGNQIALDAGVAYDIELARSATLKQLPSSPSKVISDLFAIKKPICVIHAESLRKDWEGRSLRLNSLKPSVELLKARGFRVVLVGGPHATPDSKDLARLCSDDLCGKTTLEDIFSLVRNASLFVGMDSGPLHVAQLLNIPSFVIFGATLPFARLLNLSNSYGYVRANLDCIGCYHLMCNSPTNFCVRRDEACVKGLNELDVRQKLERFLDNPGSFSFNAFLAERRVLATRQTSLAVTSSGKQELSQARLRELTRALASKLYRVVADRFAVLRR
jgi:ADP-heptose:LPS heptosyltransferase/GT2 family glycosyltransferase